MKKKKLNQIIEWNIKHNESYINIAFEYVEEVFKTIKNLSRLNFLKKEDLDKFKKSIIEVLDELLTII